LVGEGNLSPTAQQVADRAAVGIRSVFRHFSDMESLYATLDARLTADVLPMLQQTPPEGPLRARAVALVRQRASFFERISPYKRASNLQRQRSPFLAAEHRKFVALLRQDLFLWLPELEGWPAETLEALEQATSFEAWDRLRGEQRLGRTRAVAAMECAVLALIGARKDEKSSVTAR
jgi:AcrR family transcriptional regulator